MMHLAAGKGKSGARLPFPPARMLGRFGGQGQRPRKAGFRGLLGWLRLESGAG
jgi:hypothetical protein